MKQREGSYAGLAGMFVVLMQLRSGLRCWTRKQSKQKAWSFSSNPHCRTDRGAGALRGNVGLELGCHCLPTPVTPASPVGCRLNPTYELILT